MNTHDIYANIPGYTQHAEAIQRVDQRLKEVQTLLPHPQITADGLADMALAGQPFPENHALDNERAKEEAVAIDRMKMDFRRTKDVLVRRQTVLLVNHAPVILGTVENELLSIVEQAKGHARTLGSLRSEADVYRTRDDAKIDAWEALVSLAKAYEAARDIQYSVYAGANTGKSRSELSRVIDFANSLDVLSYWRDARRSAYNQTARDTSGGVSAYLKWLKDTGEAQVKHLPHGFRASEHGPAELISIALHTRPWAPTIEVVLELLEAGNRIVAFDVSRGGLASRENARDKWFSLTGSKPVAAYENNTNGNVPGKAIRRTGHDGRTLADLLKMNLG